MANKKGYLTREQIWKFEEYVDKILENAKTMDALDEIEVHLLQYFEQKHDDRCFEVSEDEDD